MKFTLSALDGQNEPRIVHIEAQSEDFAIATVRGMGLHPTAITHEIKEPEQKPRVDVPATKAWCLIPFNSLPVGHFCCGLAPDSGKPSLLIMKVDSSHINVWKDTGLLLCQPTPLAFESSPVRDLGPDPVSAALNAVAFLHQESRLLEKTQLSLNLALSAANALGATAERLDKKLKESRKDAPGNTSTEE